MCRSHRCFTLLVIAFLWALPAGAGNEPHWSQVSSAHFSVLTDGGGKKAAETLLRFEQMRAVFGQLLLKDKVIMSEPLDIIAFKTTAEYAATAPGHAGQPSSSGSFVPGDDRNYVLLDLSDENSWQTVARDLARVLLRYNYPPVPAWFDVGFAEYFSSLRLDDQAVHLGDDPASFLAALGKQPWLSLQELLTTRASASQATIFRAQSWLVVHYLISNNKLPETGTYFGLVELKKAPVGQAIQQAYGVTADQFANAVRGQFRSFRPASQTVGTSSGTTAGLQQFPALTPNDVGTSSVDVPLSQAQALVAEAAVRQPEHRAEGVKELERLTADPKTDSSIAHRSLAWVHLQNKEYPQAMDELGNATGLNRNDPWARYYLALVKYREGQEGNQEIPGLANMMQDLRAVIDWNPEFAEAYNMLAMARLQGGGTHSALRAMQIAIQLSPRDQTYLLHLAQIYMAGKNWDEATELLNRLQSDSDAQVASAAKQDLQDLPTLKKYGILPQRSASTAKPAAVWSSPPDDEDESAANVPTAPEFDRRKTEYLQGRLLKVDCSNPPIAIVTISAHGRVRRFRTGDYKSLTLIGADAFSCEWRNQPVVINYKAGGKTSGDLVSLEIR